VVSLLVVVVALVILNLLSLWQINSESGTFRMAPTLPPCNGKVLAEGFTYLFRDPHRGEIVMFRARGSVGGQIVPTAHHANLQVNKRAIAIPGDTVVGKNGRVYVDGQPADDIPTDPFPARSGAMRLLVARCEVFNTGRLTDQVAGGCSPPDVQGRRLVSGA